MLERYLSRTRATLPVAIAAVLLWPISIWADNREDFFERHVRPLLVDKCVGCHGAEKQEGGIRLDSRAQVLHGTDEVEALVQANELSGSRLWQVIQYSEDDVQMPPKAKLTAQQLAKVKDWIEAGAYWPATSKFGEAEAVDKNVWRQHWAFQPVTAPRIPDGAQGGDHPIDAFVAQKLDSQKIKPAVMADGRTLARRLSYAIAGLPAERNDLDIAEALDEEDELNVWLTRYADRLLASPKFGERWARYWLDIARYADTKGYVFQEERDYKEAWKYREWVIKSLNSDMAYDEFLMRQIAADQMDGSEDPDQLAAMGFLTLGRRFLNNPHDIIDDRIDVLSRGTMALTVTCARCHDHKFDPIPTTDYYSLYGIFNSSDEPKNEPSTLRLVDREKPREPVVFVRGSAGNRGERVTRHFLSALSQGEPEEFKNGSGRLELAQQIANADNPLTARVAVNRVWMRLFGRGLVDSPSDFGVRTPLPSHPELLDHLTSFFVRNSWSRKKLIRYIVTSSTWRQSSAARLELSTTDPDNRMLARMLARMPRRRLDFEAFRDSVLSVCGTLEDGIGGASIDIDATPYSGRRTVYARIDRQNLPGIFRTFDFASPDSHVPKRFETSVPQQALFQLNSPFIMSQAMKLADSLPEEDVGCAENRVTALYRRVLNRQPDVNELAVATQFLTDAESVAPEGDPRVGWLYGWGEIDPAKTRVVRFDSMPSFHEGRWSGSPRLPDTSLGWCMLNKTGGHAGGDLQHCPIRRWVADVDCTVNVHGKLQHSAESGDGVTGHVLSSMQSLASATVKAGHTDFHVSHLQLTAGEAIDFVIDCGANESHDSFKWRMTIQQKIPGRGTRRWDSEDDFSEAPATVRLSPAGQLAQMLLVTNEFMFVD